MRLIPGNRRISSLNHAGNHSDLFLGAEIVHTGTALERSSIVNRGKSVLSFAYEKTVAEGEGNWEDAENVIQVSLETPKISKRQARE